MQHHGSNLALLAAGVMALGFAGERLAGGASGLHLVTLVAAVVAGGAAVVAGLLGLVGSGRDDHRD